MRLPDAPIHCALPTSVRFGVGIPLGGFCLLMIVVALLNRDDGWFASLCCALMFALGFVALVAESLRRVRADADGVSWRDRLGRTHAAPWASVVAVHDTLIPGTAFRRHSLELADRRLVSWDSRWAHAEALRERVVRRLDRGAYRAPGDRFDDVPLRFAFPAAGPRLEALGAVAAAAAAAWMFVSLGARIVDAARDGGDLAVGLNFFVLFAVVIGTPLVGFSWLFWVRRREHCAEAVLVDARGLAVVGGPSPFRAAWNDVLAVNPRFAPGVVRLHVATAAGDFLAPDVPNGFHALLQTRVPRAVRAAWRRADAEQVGNVPAEVAAGTFRHALRVSDNAPWSLDAFAAIVVFSPLWRRFTLLTERDHPDATATSVAALVALWALLVVVHRVVRALIRVTVSPEGCEWHGLRHRRRFAWSDVVAVTFPDAASSRLTLRLADGTTLRGWPIYLAGGHELVATLRERLSPITDEREATDARV